ncbi:hypothetical protein V5O48_012079 [Marasmius crinis-equi]|uniref:Uncharacterized protein n=1 Tax=Marasmius crinis-equi TaxID=585013 RepID=A0ABR3F3R4_9AGAR
MPRNSAPLQKPATTEPTHHPGLASRVPPDLPIHSVPSTKSNVSATVKRPTFLQDSSALMAVDPATISHLTLVQREMLEWEISEECSRQDRQREFEVEMRREYEQYHPNPDSANFWSLKVGMSTELPHKEAQTQQGNTLGHSKTHKAPSLSSLEHT